MLRRVVERGASIGSGGTILGGVTIGSGATVGAGRGRDQGRRARGRPWSGTQLGDDRQRARLGRERDLGALADVVAVDLDREGAEGAVLGLGDRVIVAPATPSKCSIWRWRAAGRFSLKRREIRVGMSRCAPASAPERERAVVDLDPLADPHRAAGEVGEGVGVLGERGDALGGLAAVDLDPQPHRVDQVAAVEGRDRRPGEVVGPGRATSAAGGRRPA